MNSGVYRQLLAKIVPSDGVESGVFNQEPEIVKDQQDLCRDLIRMTCMSR